MIKSIYTITIRTYDYFTGYETRSLEYETLLEAYNKYKSLHQGDFDFGDHWQKTMISHRIIRLDEPHKQHGLSKKTDSTMEEDIGFILPEGELIFEDFTDVKDIVPSPEHEEEYVFDKDEYIF